MRKSVMIGAGIASAAVLAVAGIASANAPTGSQAQMPTLRTAPSLTTNSTAVSRSDAERIALAMVPGARVTETRLDTDNGRTVWNVHLSTPTGKIEVKVDAETGQARIDDGDDDHGHGDDGHDGDDDHGGHGHDGGPGND